MAERDQPEEQTRDRTPEQPAGRAPEESGDQAAGRHVARLVDEAGEMVAEAACPPDEQFVGNVLTVAEDGGKAHYLVKAVEPGEPVTLRVVRAHSTLRRGGLLLIILAACWFLIDYLVELISGP